MKAASCSLKPPLITYKDGSKGESKLFSDLMILGKNRQFAINELFTRAVSDNFINKYKDMLEFDKITGEPTLNSFIKIPEIQKILSDKNITALEFLQKKYQTITKSGNRKSYALNEINNVLDKVKQFTEDSLSEKYVLNAYYSNGNLYLQVSPKDSINVKDKMSIDNLLNVKEELSYIFSIFNEKGHNTLFYNLFNSIKATNLNDFAITLSNILYNVFYNFNNPKDSKTLIPTEAKEIFKYLLFGRSVENDIISQNIQSALQTYMTKYKMSNTEAWDRLFQTVIDLNNGEKNVYVDDIAGVLDVINNYVRNEINMMFSTNGKSNVENINKIQELANIVKEGLYTEPKTEKTEEDLAFETAFGNPEELAKLSELLEKIKTLEEKRFAIAAIKYKKDFVKSNEHQTLLHDLDEYTTDETGIQIFLKSCLERLSELQTLYEQTQDKASVLRYIKDTIVSYQMMLEEIQKTYRDINTPNKKEVMEMVNETLQLCFYYNTFYKEQVLKTVHDILSPLLPEGIEIETRVSHNNVTTQTLEDILSYAPKDVSFTDKFLDGLADSSDAYLQLYAKFVNDQKEKIRQKVMTVEDRINKAVAKYNKNGGNNNFEWLYEHDVRTGEMNKNFYIRKVSYSKYAYARDAYKAELIKKGIDPESNEFYFKMSSWYKENLDYNGEPVFNKYKSEEFENLTSVQKELWTELMSIYEDAINKLPPKMQHTYDSVKIMNSNWERLRHINNFNDAKETLKDKLREDWTRYSDDIEYGMTSSLQDFENKPINQVPIYYTKLKNPKDIKNLTTDIPSAILSFSAMAEEYFGLNKIVDKCEILVEQARYREVQQNSAGKKLVENINGKLLPNTKKGEVTNIVQKLLAYNDAVLYGKRQKDHGTIGNTNIDIAKSANMMNRLASLNTYALNMVSGIVNILTGRFNERIEAMGGQFYNNKDMTAADAFWSKNIISHLSNIGKNVKTDVLSALNRRFDILQDYNVKDNQYNVSRVKRILGENCFYVFNSAGEFLLQMNTFLAIAHHHKVKNFQTGEEKTLLDIFEILPIDENNPDAGVTVQINQEYRNLDGSEITDNQVDMLSRRARVLNNRMHGIYNEVDKNLFQQYAVGRMVMMFRKYLKPALNRRFQSKTYIKDLDSVEEGYYRTTVKFLWNIIKEIKTGKIAIAATWDNLEEFEKSNIRKAMFEMGVAAILSFVLTAIDWEDDDDENYLLNLSELCLRRFQTETTALTPSTDFIKSNLKLVQQPAAAVSYFEKLSDLGSSLLSPYDDFISEESIIQSGRFKDYRKGVKNMIQVLPFIQPVQRAIDPQEFIRFYK